MEEYTLGAIESPIDLRNYKGVCCVSNVEFPKEFACNTPKIYITQKSISRMNKQIVIDLHNILLPRKLN